MTQEAIKACQMMQIDPKSLKLVTEQDLINQGIEEHIAAVRVEHIQEKRIKRIKMIENTIRSGMLNQMQTAMETIGNHKNNNAQKQQWNSM